jgi:hypothetical protein
MASYTNEYIADQIKTKVRKDGGFSTFWVEENHRRAFVASEMFADGRLIREGGRFPFVACRIAAQKGTP